MVKKIVLGVLITLAICSLLLVAQIKVATYLYDSKLDSALAKVEARVPGLQLDYQSTEETFTQRKGRLHFTLPLKPGNKLQESYVSGAIDMAVLFGPLRVSGAFDSVPEVGNISAILQKFNVDPLTLHGAFAARAITPKLDGTLKTDSFLLPTSTGLCKFGQNSLTFSATSAENVDLQLNSAGVICEGAMRYNDKPNYRLDLLGVNVNFLPRIVNKRIHFDSLAVNLSQLDFKFSTIYALGFEPNEEVKDPSLQEAISFDNVSTLITMSPPDANGMAKLSFDNSGNYGFAFPYVANNVEQPFYRLENFKLAGSVDRLSFHTLIQSVKDILEGAGEQFDSKAAMQTMMRGFSDEIKLDIEKFGYEHNGLGFTLSGNTVFALDTSGRRPKLSKFTSTYDIQADQALVREAAGETYKEALDMALSSGHIAVDGAQYKTVLSINGKDAYMNNMPLKDFTSSAEDEEQLYAEEQRMQAEEAAKAKREQEALEAEIRAAQEAQSNLPSFYESQMEQEALEQEGQVDPAVQAPAGSEPLAP